MSELDYDRAMIRQSMVADQIRSVLGRFVGTSLRRDKASGEWVVHLMISWKVSPLEVTALHQISESAGIHIEYYDEMQPARLATG